MVAVEVVPVPAGDNVPMKMTVSGHADAWPWLVRCASLLSAEKRKCDISSFVYTSY